MERHGDPLTCWPSCLDACETPEGWASCRCFSNRDAEFRVWKAVILMSSLMSPDPSRWKRWHLMSYCSGTSPNQDWQSSFFQPGAYWGMFSSLACCFFLHRKTKKWPDFDLQWVTVAGTRESLSTPHVNTWLRHIHLTDNEPTSAKLVTKLFSVEFTAVVWLMWSQVWPLPG